MIADLPKLTFLPVDKLLIHERHDDERTLPLIMRIRNSGVFRNPPIVCPLQDGSGRYMVMDGANRVTALKEMGYPDALVQVVEHDDPGMKLQTWNHVVWELNPERFLSGIRTIPGIRPVLTKDPDAQPDLQEDCGLAMVCTCRGHLYTLCTDAEDLETRVDLLNAIVDSYKDRSRLDRTNSRNVELLKEVYPQLSGIVIFPHFDIQDILRLAGNQYLLPSGITRFMISPRVLHVNYPLEELAADKPLEQKNAELQKWLQDRLARKGVRYYAEATFLFDE